MYPVYCGDCGFEFPHNKAGACPQCGSREKCVQLSYTITPSNHDKISNPTELGFKPLSVENWLTVDPTWHGFVISESVLTPSAEEWVREFLGANLDQGIPLKIRQLFETARGTLIYSLMFYPLLAAGTEQLYRVMEAAVTHKCIAMNAPHGQTRTFENKITWLVKNTIIPEEQHLRWDAIRHLRNGTSHSRNQSIINRGMALGQLETVVELINELFF